MLRPTTAFLTMIRMKSDNDSHSTCSVDAFIKQTDTMQQQRTALLLDTDSHTSSPMATSSAIHRHALDIRGRPGSWYDAASDRVIPSTTQDAAAESITLDKPAIYQLFRGDQISLDTLLQHIGIEEDLRLSLYLHLTDPTGIGRIVNHGHPFNRHTRLFYFCWKQTRTTLRPTSAMFANVRGWWQAPSEATHRITSVTSGIDLLLVVHPQAGTEDLGTSDDLLDRLGRALVENGTEIDKVCRDQKQLFEGSAYHDVYSNVPDLRRERCLSDVFQLIHRMKTGRGGGHPIKYDLQPLKHNPLAIQVPTPFSYALNFIFSPAMPFWLCCQSSHSWYPLYRELTQQLLDMVAKPFHVLKIIDNVWHTKHQNALLLCLQNHINQGHA